MTDETTNEDDEAEDEKTSSVADDRETMNVGDDQGTMNVGDDEDANLGALVERLHAELRATEELPVERSASRWIGEAQAVAADAADAIDATNAADAADGVDAAEAADGVPSAVVRERVGHVRDLLANVEATGSTEADERVDRARAIAARIAADE